MAAWICLGLGWFLIWASLASTIKELTTVALGLFAAALICFLEKLARML